jgi:ribosome-associated translation inhibitor RaiA
MKVPNERPGLQVRIDAHQCQLSAAVVDRMQADVEGLARQAAAFPVAELHVLVAHNARTNDYSVKTSLILPGETLMGSDTNPAVNAAFLRCLESLESNLADYKQRLDGRTERQKEEKGTRQEVSPTMDPDPQALQEAVAAGDYAAFRAASFGYEESVRRRVGRWLERYPAAEARIGNGVDIDDVVEAVFLDAFEGYEHRPAAVRFGEWMEHRIDPAVRAVAAGSDDWLENVRLARTAREAQAARE